MAMASMGKLVLGSIAFGFFWVLAVFPTIPCMPVGRTTGALFGVMLMIIFQVISQDEAYEAIDLPILGLLFGTMIVSVYLERADMFKYLGKLLTWKGRQGKDLLFSFCLISAIFSALFTNDTCCVVLTEFILRIARQNNLPPQPFILALTSSSNIGSAATLIAVDGFNKTEIPSTLWDAVERYSHMDNTGGITLLSVVIIVLSNVASNVLTVLLGSRVAALGASISSSEEARAWLILAWVSTVAGNLSLLGSTVNLIVCEQARRAQFYSYNLTFWSHLKFGVPSIIIVTIIGLPLIWSY